MSRSRSDIQAVGAVRAGNPCPPSSNDTCEAPTPSGGLPASAYAHADAQDSALRAALAPITSGVSPYAALQAWADWGFHLSIAPWRVGALVADACVHATALAQYACDPSPQRADRAPFHPAPDDRRFRDASWSRPPFDVAAQSHLALESWWRHAAAPLRGMRDHHIRRVDFTVRQALNALAPVNFPWSNPLVWDAAARTGGTNFVDGARILRDDLQRVASRRKLADLDGYRVGENLAVTPGDVIFRNTLMEVIQYRPVTERVIAEPILIVPAWIMKYYILDLRPEDSLIRFLVERGFTVFCISWKNPDAAMGGVSFEDYRIDGVMAALEAIAARTQNKVHAVGYCLGGTVLATTAAAMARDSDDRLATLTLLAAQTDFSEAGELMMFIGESQIAALEDIMTRQGFLDARQMSGAFYVLRANEMVWARFVERYLLGQRHAGADLEFWLADPTRMPARMHSQYLRWLFMENRLAEGRLKADGRSIYLKDIQAPVFAVGAERDHIAPWRSVHKIALHSPAETTFVLTGGGHNAGIVSPPGKPGAYYRLGVIGSQSEYEDPDEWLDEASRLDGSWWPQWAAWLENHSSGERVSPPPREPCLSPAPGLYVLEP